MAANDRNFNLCCRLTFKFGDKSIRTNDIEGGNAKQFVLSYTPAFFSTSAAIATVVFTGLVIIPMQACGQVLRSAAPCFNDTGINIK